jgi:hypothetical protein
LGIRAEACVVSVRRRARAGRERLRLLQLREHRFFFFREVVHVFDEDADVRLGVSAVGSSRAGKAKARERGAASRAVDDQSGRFAALLALLALLIALLALSALLALLIALLSALAAVLLLLALAGLVALVGLVAGLVALVAALLVALLSTLLLLTFLALLVLLALLALLALLVLAVLLSHKVLRITVAVGPVGPATSRGARSVPHTSQVLEC